MNELPVEIELPCKNELPVKTEMPNRNEMNWWRELRISIRSIDVQEA